MIRRLQKKHTILSTSRKYREVTQLSKIRNLKLKFVGKHGGSEKYHKLNASTNRINQLSKIIQKFSPDITVSFCSPEASRVSYGLGIKHIAFSDSPHAKDVMQLSLPFIQKLLIPWIIPKNEFLKYGIKSDSIIQYKAIDAATIVKSYPSKKIKKLFNNKNRKNILIRIVEEQAAYSPHKNNTTNAIIKSIIKEFNFSNIIILGRYESQIKHLNQIFGKHAKVLKNAVDGRALLESTDVFIGSGGTMTAESALLGIPTISYNAVPNFIEDYLVRKRLVKRETNPKRIVQLINDLFNDPEKNKIKAKKIVNAMEDPFEKLLKAFKM